MADAVDQYRFDRLPQAKGKKPEPLLNFPRGALVHFAVSDRDMMMTTRLAGPDTRFLPFNKGDNDAAGNPMNPNSHRTTYLWEDILQRDSWLEILGCYMVGTQLQVAIFSFERTTGVVALSGEVEDPESRPDVFTAFHTYYDTAELDKVTDPDHVDLSKVTLIHYKLKRKETSTLVIDGDADKLKPMTETGTASVQDKEKALLAEILNKMNDLFPGDFSDNDTRNYRNTL